MIYKTKLGEMLVSFMKNISNSFLVWFWRLGPTSGLFLSFEPVEISQPVIMSFNFFYSIEGVHCL